MDLNEYCYVCYSTGLYEKFKSNRIKYFIKGNNEKTNRMFYVYPKTDEVLDILDKWTKGYWKQ